MTDYPKFIEALKSLGKNDAERGEVLGVSVRTIKRYRAGILPPPLPKMAELPALADAFALDAHNRQKKARTDSTNNQET